MTKEYPVQCSFGAYSFLFESPADMQSLILNLDGKITGNRAAA